MGIRENLKTVLSTLEPDVSLIAVSKTKPAEDIREAYAAGQRSFGENKVQELMEKVDQLPEDIQWHFIGNLQRNKVKYLDERIHLVHSLDRPSLARALDKNARSKGFVQKVLLEVNIGREENKGGALIEDLPELIRIVRDLPGLHVKGLMAVIPETQDEAVQKDYFSRMARLFEQEKEHTGPRYEMEILSMGMSGDYRMAMACGSNMVRIGSAIFGARDYGPKAPSEPYPSDQTV